MKNEPATRKQKKYPKKIASFGKVLKGSGAQVVFFTVLPMGNRDLSRRKRTDQLNDSFRKALHPKA